MTKGTPGDEVGKYREEYQLLYMLYLKLMVLLMIVLQRTYLVVVLLPSCLPDHPLVQIQHHPSHLTNLTCYGRFLLKDHHNQVAKVTSLLYGSYAMGSACTVLIKTFTKV